MSTRRHVRAGRPWVAGLLFAVAALPPPASARDDSRDVRQGLDVVAVAVVDRGRAIVLATPGVPYRGRRWRFRSLDTSELRRPIVKVALSASGTKLFVQGANDRGGVLDLTRQDRHNTALQYVAPDDLATGGDGPRSSHRLAGQRFESVANGISYVLDDYGRVLAESPALDGAVYRRTASGPTRSDTPQTPASMLEDALQAAVGESGSSIDREDTARLVASLLRESRDVAGALGETLTEWQFFHVTPDAEIYAPVLQFAPSETVFPAPFDTLEQLAARVPAGSAPSVRALYDRYMRTERTARIDRCTYYFHTISAEGSWLIEYWIYYPFDVGGLGSHPHDPEHLFVEVDKLGGAPRRVIGAGHGYMAGNNIYSADKPGAAALRLPLYAIVELGKHATAPDVDRDGMFTPGVDENEYHERAKIWGVRDAIGTINNEFLAYDRTMTVVRRPQDAVALTSAGTVFGAQPDFAGRPSCRLEPLGPGQAAAARRAFRVSDWILLPPCDGFTTDCARRHVTAHPDFLDARTVLKEWAFPSAFLRATTGVGPRRGFRTVGLGYLADMDAFPALGRILPLPGRLGIEAFYWRQDVDDPDHNSCLAECKRSGAVGWGLRYDTFISNLFGIYGATRVYSAPLNDLWVTFGPFIEAPLGRRSNVSVEGGLAFRPTESPRFEFRINFGLWKPKSRLVGMRAAKGAGE